jgi:hypothetical protein
MFSPIVIFQAVIQLYFLSQACMLSRVFGSVVFSVETVFVFLMSLVFELTILSVIRVFSQHRKYLSIVLQLLYIGFYALLAAYLFKVKLPFDSRVMMENGTSAFKSGSWSVIWNNLDKVPLKIFGLFCIFILITEYRSKKSSKHVLHFSKKKVAVWALLCVVLISFKPSIARFNEPIRFVQSLISYGVDNMESRKIKPIKTKQEGFTYSTLDIKTPAEKPHVFLIMVEAFNQFATTENGPSGTPVMPYYKFLKKQGLSIDTFYGHHVQTIHGQMAVMLSLPPHTTGKPFENYKDIKTMSLANTMNDNGYSSYYYQASEAENFDHKKELMTQVGF